MAKGREPVPDTGAVAESWRHFESDILPRIVTELPPGLKALPRTSFYFGALIMLNAVQPLSERSTDTQRLHTALALLKAEVQAHMVCRSRN